MEIATVSSGLRMIVIQFLVSRDHVPPTIPLKRASDTAPIKPVAGTEVLPSTPRLHLLNLLDISNPSDGLDSYELIDAWFEYTERPDDKRKVRYVFCHKDHVRHDSLNPDFLRKHDELMDSLAKLLDQNLWAVQGFLNPYLEADGSPTGHRVLMLNCAGRVATSKVWSHGRDPETKRGLGQLVDSETIAKRIVMEDKAVVLKDPPALTANA